jgi:hypothetical protein
LERVHARDEIAVATPFDAIGEKLKAVATGWSAYTAFASFLLYVLGYLTLRFHLTALGVGTDLTVLDERYLFAGARFVVYLVSAVPIVLLLALIVLGVLYVPFWLLPASIRSGMSARWTQIRAQPIRLTVAGIIISVLMIQLVMRQCFAYSNLLLAPNLPPEPAWLACLMRNDGLMSLFYSALIAGAAIPAAIAFGLNGSPEERRSYWLLRAMLIFLIAVQLLLLPANYGVLIVDKSLARVGLIGAEPVKEGLQAWLVWEGKDAVTYFIRKSAGNTRSLLTIPRVDAKKTDIIGYDRIVPTLVSDPEERRE